MNIEIGTKIKALRLSASMTQEQLAEKLGVSAQAVSKWESCTNMPDIQLLPDISVIFGVSIDELFAMTDESRMERIENMILNVRFLSEQDFAESERYLKQCQKKENLRANATFLLAMLYNKRADEYHTMAAPLAREALEQMPENKDVHTSVFEAEKGPFQDWNTVNHGKLIEFYCDIIKKHPTDIHSYFWLLDLLIADCRTVEARARLEEMHRIEESYHYEMYRGYICRAEGNLSEAVAWWKRMTEHQPECWKVWAEYASCMAKLGRYDEAIPYYQKAMSMRPKPRFTDCEEALSQIYEIKGDYSAALEMRKQMLAVVKEDWTTEGECVDCVLREIKRLEPLIQRQQK